MRTNTTARVSSAQQTARPCSVWQAKLRGARDVVELVISVTACVFNASLDRRRWDDWQEGSKLRTTAPERGPLMLCDGQYLDDPGAHGIESLEDGAQETSEGQHGQSSPRRLAVVSGCIEAVAGARWE